jgi:hypothetical protein
MCCCRKKGHDGGGDDVNDDAVVVAGQGAEEGKAEEQVRRCVGRATGAWGLHSFAGLLTCVWHQKPTSEADFCLVYVWCSRRNPR